MWLSQSPMGNPKTHVFGAGPGLDPWALGWKTRGALFPVLWAHGPIWAHGPWDPAPGALYMAHGPLIWGYSGPIVALCGPILPLCAL